MNKLYCMFFILLFSFSSYSQTFEWVREVRGSISEGQETVKGQAVDNNGNSYSIGDSDSIEIDLDPTIAGVDMAPGGGAYLIKVDNDGNYIWGKAFGAFTNSDYAVDVKIGTDHNIYAMISLQNASAAYRSDTKILKIAPDGTILSTITIPQNYGSGGFSPYSFEIDNQNNFFISGFFHGTVPFSPGNPDLTLSSEFQIKFILKADNLGNFLWCKELDYRVGFFNKMQIRPDGNINIVVDDSTKYTMFNLDNSTGATIWQRDFTGQWLNTFNVSGNNIVIAGEKPYYETVDVDPSSGTALVSGYCKFIIFLDLNGNFVEVKKFDAVNYGISFNAIAGDALGNIYFGGSYNETIDFDASSNISNITPPYFGSTFLLKYDENLNYESVVSYGQETPLQDVYNICHGIMINTITVLNNDDIFLGGNFTRVCDFDPSPTTYTSLDSVELSTVVANGFIQKFSPCNAATPSGAASQIFCTAENPTVSDLQPSSNNIHWYSSATGTVPLSNTAALVHGQHYFAARQIGSCPESLQRLEVAVTITGSPAPPVASSQTFCGSEFAMLSDIIVTGQNLKWYDSATAAVELPATTLLQDSTNYFVSQSVGCESGRTPVYVTVNATPEPVGVSPQSFCIQQAALLSDLAVTGQNIRWYDSLVGGNEYTGFPLLQDGMIYYASQTIDNCESLRIPIYCSIYDTPPPVANALQNFCTSQNPVLGTIVVSGADILWYSLNSGGIPLATNTALVNGVTYYATQTLNDCESTIRTAVAVSIISTLNAVNYAETLCDDLNDGKETVNLSNYRQYLISDFSNSIFSYYTTLPGAENALASDLVDSIVFYPLTPGLNTVFVRIDSINGCTQIVQLLFTLVSVPVISLPEMIAICEGTETVLDAGAEYDSYRWSTGETTETISVSDAGLYTVTVSVDHGGITCSSSKNINVVSSDIAVISSIAVDDWTDDGNVITVNVTGNGDYEYSLDGIIYQDSNIFTGLTSGIYTVNVRDKSGCGVVEEDVVLFMYSKYFTPNADGYNDTWSLNNSGNVQGVVIVIFDRYGRIIHQMASNESWDGNYKGSILPADDYWFIIGLPGEKEQRGHFSLKR